MAAASDPPRSKPLRELLAEVDVGIEINRYEFSVAAARRAREIHEMTSDDELKTQQRSLRKAVTQLISGSARIEKEKPTPPTR